MSCLDKLIAKGNTASIYLSGNKLIKLFNENKPSGEAQREAYKQKYAYSLKLPVPETYEVTNINGRQAIIMEYVEGRSFGELIMEDAKHTECCLSISVDMQRRIHIIEANSIEPMHDKLKRQISCADMLNNNQKDKLLRRLSMFPEDNKLCHGDFHVYNIIEGKSGAVIIDWVDASAGNICADVYRTYLLYMQHSKDLADLYLELYIAKSGINKDEVLNGRR